MTVLAAALTAASLLVLLTPGDSGRLAQAVPNAGRLAASQRRATGRAPALSGATSACLFAGIVIALLLPLPVGVPAGAALAGAGPRLLRRLEPRAVRAEREQLLADLPLVLDLLAACLAGGAPLGEAAAAVADAVPGPAGRRLSVVSSALRVGSPPREAWSALAGAGPDDPLLPAARALARAADGGAPVATAVSRLAAEARADARGRGEQAARQVGVRAVAPLGLCFLPAFVLLGIVPVVVGLAGPLLASF